MAVSKAFAEHVHELLAPFGPVSTRRMFGGAGVYLDGLMFGLIAGETLFFKADAQTKPVWEAAGSEPFSFSYKDGRREITSYWSLPPGAVEDAEAAERWALLGWEAAVRAKRPRKAGREAAPAADLGPGPWDAR